MKNSCSRSVRRVLMWTSNHKITCLECHSDEIWIHPMTSPFGTLHHFSRNWEGHRDGLFAATLSHQSFSLLLPAVVIDGDLGVWRTKLIPNKEREFFELIFQDQALNWRIKNSGFACSFETNAWWSGNTRKHVIQLQFQGFYSRTTSRTLNCREHLEPFFLCSLWGMTAANLFIILCLTPSPWIDLN